MLRILFALLLCVTLLSAHVRADGLPPGDQSAIRDVITGQLQAFSSDHDAEAYGYAAPIIQFAFPTVDSFMAMVKKGYQPVHRNNGYQFGASDTISADRATQTVIIKGTDGKHAFTFPLMACRIDGSWTIVR